MSIETAASVRSTRGKETRERILDTALTLFRQHGYHGTTMRAIAREAGVSLGSAYYYFRSKDHLIQKFYDRVHEEHLAACDRVLEEETDFQRRLRGTLEAKIDTIQPYHRFSGVLFKTAADPASPLSPFSSDSMPVRRQATALFDRVVTGSNIRVPDQLAAELPNLLWLYQMGIVLYWIHDQSERCRKTYRLIEATSRIVARLTQLASNPLLQPLRKTTVRLMKELR